GRTNSQRVSSPSVNPAVLSVVGGFLAVACRRLTVVAGLVPILACLLAVRFGCDPVQCSVEPVVALAVASVRLHLAHVDEIRRVGSGCVAVTAGQRTVDAGLSTVTRSGIVPGKIIGPVPLFRQQVPFLREPVPFLAQTIALVGGGVEARQIQIAPVS